MSAGDRHSTRVAVSRPRDLPGASSPSSRAPLELVLALVLVLMPALALIACGDEDRKPDEAVAALVRAADVGDARRVFELLAPETQAALKKLADVASAQTGGVRRFGPEDLLITGYTPTLPELATVQVLERSDTRAVVKLISTKGKTETLELVAVNDRWRLALPPPTEK